MRRDYVVIPTGFAVAYRSSKGDYIAVCECVEAKAAASEAARLNAQAAADAALVLAAAQKRSVRNFEEV